MTLLFKRVKLFKPIPLIIIIWFLLAFTAVLAEVLRSSINNFNIFSGVFWHTFQQTNLYSEYPAEYWDTNHYGPVFSLLIAPFALLPKSLGCILWCLANAAILLFAIKRINIAYEHKLIILAISAIEMMTAIHNVQFNPMLAAWLILAYAFVEDEMDFWATLFIAAGFFIKLYGIAGLLFFVFSKHKVKFCLSFGFWCIVLFVAPMLISSPSFIIQSYQDWYYSLVEKNAKNANIGASGGMQDLSVMGMIRRIGQVDNVGVLHVIAPAVILISIPLLRFKQYLFKEFRLSYLAIVLITVVIFSSSAESSTYVIALVGVGIWYILHYQDQKTWSNIILVLVLLLTSLSATDLFPRYIRTNYVRAYSLKALPCFIVWLWLIADVLFKNYQLKENRLPETE